MVRLILGILGVALVLGLVRVGYVVTRASGALSHPEYTDNAACMPVEIAPGTEDVTYDAVSGLVFVSAAERRSGEMSPRNGIYVFDPEDAESVRLVSIDAPADFRPHGISLWRGASDSGAPLARLFVISHPYSGHQVLIYDVAEDGALSHLQTVSYDALRSPNDIVGVGPDQFYATNDVYFGDTLMGYLEAFLGLPLGSISYYDGQEGRIVADGLAYANGVTINADGSELYASGFIGRTLHVFDRDADTAQLTRTARHPIPLGLDNIEIGTDGALYIAGNVSVFDFLAHQSDPAARAPAQAVRVDPQTGDWTTVFADSGEAIDSPSVATRAGDQLLLGAVFDSHVLVCPYGAN
jgi:arylesterase/paraoxonase